MLRSANSFYIRYKLAIFFFGLAVWHNYLLFLIIDLYDLIYPSFLTRNRNDEIFSAYYSLVHVCIVFVLVVRGTPYFEPLIIGDVLNLFDAIILFLVGYIQVLSIFLGLILKDSCGSFHSYFFVECSKLLTVCTWLILWNSDCNFSAALVAEALYNIPESDCSGSTLIRIETDDRIVVSFPNLNACAVTNQQTVDGIINVNDIVLRWLMFSTEKTMEDIPPWMLNAISKNATPPA